MAAEVKHAQAHVRSCGIVLGNHIATASDGMSSWHAERWRWVQHRGKHYREDALMRMRSDVQSIQCELCKLL